jgi:hypothetical protein
MRAGQLALPSPSYTPMPPRKIPVSEGANSPQLLQASKGDTVINPKTGKPMVTYMSSGVPLKKATK